MANSKPPTEVRETERESFSDKVFFVWILVLGWLASGALLAVAVFGLLISPDEVWLLAKKPILICGLAFLGLLLIGFFWLWQGPSTESSSGNRALELYLVALAVLAALPGLFGIGYWSSGWLVRFAQTAPATGPFERLIVTFALLCGGAGMYWMKRRHQFSYGFLEIVCGCVANWRTLGNLPTELERSTGSPEATFEAAFLRLAVLAGGAYIVSRGASNLVEGYERTKR